MIFLIFILLSDISVSAVFFDRNILSIVKLKTMPILYVCYKLNVNELTIH